MFKSLSVVFGALLLTPFSLAQHDDSAGATASKLAPRHTGTIFKREVDGLVGVLRSTARRNVAAPALRGVLGSDVLSTAKALVAMGHCHRRYHISDGPVVRPSLNYLLASRQSDGSFGDVEATGWVVDALQIMNAEGYAEEIRDGRKWLAGQDAEFQSFADTVHDLLQEVQADRFPEHMANGSDRQARGYARAPASMQRVPAVDALVRLVVCQVANRALDQAMAKQGGSKAWSASQQQAFTWLYGQQQGGIFSITMPMKNPDPSNGKGAMIMRSFPDPALTGFGLLALQSKPKAQRTAAEQESIVAGLKWLVRQQNEDGTFGQEVVNYTTCVVVGALSRWADPSTLPVLARAQKAILMFQNSEDAGYERSDRDYGSIGYGGSQRGDLSNLQFSIEALRKTGLPEDHEALQKALVFLQRTQNLKSSNDFSGQVPHPKKDGATLEVTSGDDGGAAYYPGNSAAGYVVHPDGKAVARSYGSMTYALLKSYTLAGVKGDDPRVQAAVGWIQNNWTLAVNPGADPALADKVKYQGLFYYYMVLAQALDAAGIETVNQAVQVDGKASVRKIDWQQQLRAHLAGMQREDGSWVNGKNDRWMEGLPLLCTCYAMIALEHCK